MVQRTTAPGGAELSGIQMLRGLAALAVVIHHVLEESNGAMGRFSPDWLTLVGAAGVDMFFVISGFIMLHVSFRPGRPAERPGRFLIRRTTRIFPLYWACCGAMLVLMAAGFMRGIRPDGVEIVGALLLLPGAPMVIGVAWTLVYELLFYGVFAAMLGLRSPTRVAAGTTVALIVLILAAGLLPTGSLRAFLTNPLPIEFCFGLWLGWLHLARPLRTPPLAALAGAGALVVAALVVPHDSTAGLAGWARVIGWGVPSALIVTALAELPAPRSAGARWLVKLGDASYALYLTHAFVMIGYAWLIKHRGLDAIDQRPVVPVMVGLAVAIGFAAYYLAERPLLALARAGLARGRRVRAPELPALS